MDSCVKNKKKEISFTSLKKIKIKNAVYYTKNTQAPENKRDKQKENHTTLEKPPINNCFLVSVQPSLTVL